MPVVERSWNAKNGICHGLAHLLGNMRETERAHNIAGCIDVGLRSAAARVDFDPGIARDDVGFFEIQTLYVRFAASRGEDGIALHLLTGIEQNLIAGIERLHVFRFVAEDELHTLAF